MQLIKHNKGTHTGSLNFGHSRPNKIFFHTTERYSGLGFGEPSRKKNYTFATHQECLIPYPCCSESCGKPKRILLVVEVYIGPLSSIINCIVNLDH